MAREAREPGLDDRDRGRDDDDVMELEGPVPLAVPVQSTYPVSMPVGTPGMPATMTGWDGDTKICATAAGIGFGLAVSRSGTSGREVSLGGAAFHGVTYRDITLVHDVSAVDKYKQYENVGVMIRGDIWVPVSAAVLVADAVKFDPATGIFGLAAGTVVPGAQYIRPQATVGGLALLRLNGNVGA